MGLLRRLLWPGRPKEDDADEEAKARAWKKGKHVGHSDAYHIEVGGDEGRAKTEGPPFSFWSSSRVILILSFLLWWIQPAGPMIAGYVGGRRAGSSFKAVLAALLPVFVLFIANAAYAHTFGASQVDFVAALPQAVGNGAAAIVPFVAPYKDFLIAYLAGFVKALQTTFGMGTNGYLMVVIFAYIGGLIAEQTRRELYFRNGASQNVGFNLIQPLVGRHHPAPEDEEDEADEELQDMRHPVRAHARSAHRTTRRRGQPNRFEEFRKVNADTAEGHTTHHPGRARAAADEDEEEEEDQVRRASRSHHPLHRAQAREPEGEEDEEDPEAVARREAKEAQARKPRLRTREEEIALQRFVDRALRNYDHSKL